MFHVPIYCICIKSIFDSYDIFCCWSGIHFIFIVICAFQFPGFSLSKPLRLTWIAVASC